jgi:glycosyltransferase involved in cell wall biosynthesis
MFFSVVVPLYNKSYALQRCIDSVLSQTHQDFELIIINDGSSDDSYERLNKIYSEQIEKNVIKVINQINQGVSVARNNGVEVSSSEYVCFLDADDEWESDFLQKMNELIQDYPEAALYCLAHKISKNNAAPTKANHGLPDNFRGYVNDFFKSSSNGSVANSSKVCVKKNEFREVGRFPDGVVAGEDLYLWIMLALKGKVACDMSYSTIVYIEDDESRNARNNSIPYPFIYFSQNKHIHKPTSLNRYLFVISYKHFFSSLLSRRFKEAWLRLTQYLRVYI